MPSLAPIAVRIDAAGLIEHARGATPAPDLGHCTDDAGRALGLAGHLTGDRHADLVARACLVQLERSRRGDGRLSLRLDAAGRPTQDGVSDDADARAIWGLAVASISPLADDVRRRSRALCDELSDFVSVHPRAAAHLVCAGTALVRSDPRSTIGRRLVERNRSTVPGPGGTALWRWPEPRLTYGNGLIVEALIDLAELDGDAAGLAAALDLLDWLVRHESFGRPHFSFTAVGGTGPHEERARFDQQPIEAWALAGACTAAHRVTGDPFWSGTCRQVLRWFDGHNDLGVPMWDRTTGAAFDGLTASGPNRNQGAESTLALLGTVVGVELTTQLQGAPASRWSRRRTDAVAAPTWRSAAPYTRKIVSPSSRR